MLKAYVTERDFNLYGKKLIPLPFPQYIVFYNGSKDEPDTQELLLSDAFPEFVSKEKSALECKAVMLNINLGHNRNLLENCQRLNDYAYFVAAIRKYHNMDYPLEDAVNLTVDECIEKNRLADILIKNRAEVMNLLLTDFNERKYRKMLRREAYEEGREEGLEAGRKAGLEAGLETGLESGIRNFILDYHEEGFPKERIITKLELRFELDIKDAQNYYERYIKEN